MRWRITSFAGANHSYLLRGHVYSITTHDSEDSRDAEITTCKERMRRGEIAYIQVVDCDSQKWEWIGPHSSSRLCELGKVD